MAEHQILPQVLTSDLPGMTRLIYLTVRELVDESGVLQCSQDFIAKVAGVSRRTVIRHVEILEAAGHLIVHRAPRNSRVCNVYTLPDYTPPPTAAPPAEAEIPATKSLLLGDPGVLAVQSPPFANPNRTYRTSVL